jgi:hypothetical protein
MIHFSYFQSESPGHCRSWELRPQPTPSGASGLWAGRANIKPPTLASLSLDFVNKNLICNRNCSTTLYKATPSLFTMELIPLAPLATAGKACYDLYRTLKKVGIDFPRLSEATQDLKFETKRMRDLQQEYATSLGSIRENRLEECKQQALKVTEATNAVLKKISGLDIREAKERGLAFETKGGYARGH